MGLDRIDFNCLAGGSTSDLTLLCLESGPKPSKFCSCDCPLDISPVARLRVEPITEENSDGVGDSGSIAGGSIASTRGADSICLGWVSSRLTLDCSACKLTIFSIRLVTTPNPELGTPNLSEDAFFGADLRRRLGAGA